MKKLIILGLILSFSVTAFSQTYVKGYYRSNGTYVQGHYKTTKDNTNHNNWSTTGNTNPFTGSQGSVARDYSSQAANYGQGNIIYTGPKGGQYYYNNNSNRTYVPKQPTSTNNYYRKNKYQR